uniref:Uncharacterized protein n=1 Tax=Avena sativa TaxID=4498 RepID=A0ACD5X2X5_AVESA
MMHMPCELDQATADDLAQLGPVLYECVAHVVEGSFDKTDRSLRKIRQLASVVDGPLQRLSMIIADSLARRLLCPIQGFAAALIDPSCYLEQCCLWAARENFASISPYLSTGFVTINRAILEQVQDEKVTPTLFFLIRFSIHTHVFIYTISSPYLLMKPILITDLMWIFSHVI